jgi:hypothetical protein
MKTLTAYKVFDYDVWGNEKDGYTVNDTRSTIFTLEIDFEKTDEIEIIKELKAIGFLKKTSKNSKYFVDMTDENDITIDYSGYPVCELRKENN